MARSLSFIRSPFGQTLLARLIEERAGEDIVGAVLPAGDDLVRRGLDVVRHRLAVGRDDDRAFLHAPPGVVRLPRAVEHRLRARDVIGPPDVLDRRQLRLRREARHVGALTEAPDLALLANLETGRAVGVLRDHVAAEVGQRRDGRRLLGRIEPGVDHDELRRNLRIHCLSREGKGVHAQHHFRHLVGAEIADRAGLGHHAGDRPLDRAALVEARVVGAEIVGVLVAGAMLEHHVRELLSHLDALVHIAVGGSEDQLVPLLRQILQDRRGARVFLDVLDIVGDDLPLEGLDHRLAALLVRPGPAVVADRPEVNVADLERFGGEGGAAQRWQRQQPRGRGLQDIAASHETQSLLLLLRPIRRVLDPSNLKQETCLNTQWKNPIRRLRRFTRYQQLGRDGRSGAPTARVRELA